MSSTTRTIEHMKILQDMGNGLTNRLYYFKGTTIAKRKPQCLTDPEIAKLRAKIEKKFPTMPDPQKTQGWDLFVYCAPGILAELKDSFDLIMDIVDFTVHAKLALKEMTLNIVDFKLSRNRNLTMIYFDLLVAYIRVLKMFEFVEERNTIVALYTAAYNASPTADKELSATRTNKLKVLMADCADLTRHFIDFFSPSLVFIKPILLQLLDSIALMERSEDLRREYVLNPINEEGGMGQPTLKTLNSTTPVSLCTELASLERYYEYVCYAFVAYPALLFQEPCMEVLRMVTNSRLVVELCRDISLNIHLELERISLVFPSATDNLLAMQLPKGAKLKNVLKELSRASVAGAGLKQKERRSFVETELTNLTRLLTAVPGLLGPKFPMLLACAALAKSELVAYFRHAEGVAVRKDSKQQYAASTYYAEDIASLMGAVSAARRLIQQHRHVVTAYYTEYLTGNDQKVLRKLLTSCGAGLDSVKTYTDAMLAQLTALKPVAPGSEPTVGELVGFRLNVERAMAVCSSQVMSQGVRALGASYDALMQRLLFVHDRSLYRDSLPALLDEHLNFHRIGWFRTTFQSTYQTALLDPHGLARYAWVFFEPLQDIRLCCHADCPEEVPRMCSKAGAIANTMLADIGANTATLVKFLWDNISALQAQYHTGEVGRRAKRVHQAKLRGGAAAGAAAAAQETLPGSESEVWAKKQIENFVLIQQHLCWIVIAAREKGKFRVHDLEYDPELYLREQVLQYFATRIGGLFVNTEQNPLRFSSVFRRLTCGCLAVQYVLRLMNLDVGVAMQDLLFSEFQDSAQVPPPGLPVPLYVNLDKEKLIYKIALWFTETAQQIAHSSSGLVWSPSLQGFLNATHQGVSSEFAVEAHLNQDELVQLVTMVGVQGVRAIESQLLTLLADELMSVKKFISENRNYLRQYEKNYCLVLNAAVDVRKNDSVFESLRTIGVVLLIRDMLRGALRQCCSLSFGDMQAALQSGAESLDFYCEPVLSQALACVAADLGIPSEDCDLALAAALTKLNLSADKEVLQLLPTVAAALFVSDKWEKAVYLPKLGAFENNEHCVQVALVRLFSAFFLLSQTTLGAEHSDPLEALAAPAEPAVGQEADEAGVPKVAKRLAVRDRYKAYVERYLRIAAQTLLVQRENEHKAAKHAPQLPHRSMTIALEFFTSICPIAGRGSLEKYLPNYLIHSDVLDVALGKQKTADQLKAFVHPTAAQAETAHDHY